MTAAPPASFGFKKAQRLLRRADFLRVQGSRHRVTTNHFVFLVDRGVDPLRARIGIVVTKKVGNAVARARVKRLCRECFRLWPQMMPPGVDFVVIARQGAETLGLADVRGEWEKAWPTLKKRCTAALAEAVKADAGPANAHSRVKNADPSTRP